MSWLTNGLGGRLSAAHWRRYLYVAVTGATAKRSLYFLSSSPATYTAAPFSAHLLAVCVWTSAQPDQQADDWRLK